MWHVKHGLLSATDYTMHPPKLSINHLHQQSEFLSSQLHCHCAYQLPLLHHERRLAPSMIYITLVKIYSFIMAHLSHWPSSPLSVYVYGSREQCPLHTLQSPRPHTFSMWSSTVTFFSIHRGIQGSSIIWCHLQQCGYDYCKEIQKKIIWAIYVQSCMYVLLSQM